MRIKVTNMRPSGGETKPGIHRRAICDLVLDHGVTINGCALIERDGALTLAGPMKGRDTKPPVTWKRDSEFAQAANAAAIAAYERMKAIEGDGWTEV